MAVARERGPDQRRLALAFVALVLGACAMGASPIFVRVADVGPYASAFWRTFLALPFLWAWAQLAARQAVQTEARTTPALFAPAVILTGLFFAGDLFFWHLSILATTVANATFFATTAPIWVALVAWGLYAERIGLGTFAGLALCIAGGFALIGQSYGHAPQNMRGDIYGLITAIFFGLYILALRAARCRFDAARVSFLSTAVTAVCLFIVALALEDAMLPRSLAGAGALLALALVSQVGGQGLLAVALGTLPATFSSMVIFLEAIAAAGFAWALLGERLSLLQAGGGALILAGIWVARPRQADALGAKS